MSGPFWGPSPDANASFDSFVGQITEHVREVKAGDYWQIIGECPGCKQSLSHNGATVHVSSLPKLPAFFEPTLDRLQGDMKRGAPRCPQCDLPLDFACATQAYIARVAPLVHSALVAIYAPKDGRFALEKVHVFRPPGDWNDLGAAPSNNAVAKGWGRSIHPAATALTVLSRAAAGEKRPVQWVSSEAVLTVRYPDDHPDGDDMGPACRAAGLQPPYLFLTASPGGEDPLSGFVVNDDLRRRLQAVKANLVMVYSLLAVREKIDFWSRAYWTPMTIDQSGKVTVSLDGKSRSFSLEEIATEAGSRGFTLDEAIFDLGFVGKAVPGGEASLPPLPSVSAQALSRPVPLPRAVTPAPAAAPAAPAAPQVAYTPPQAAAPPANFYQAPPAQPAYGRAPAQSRGFRPQCRTCGAPAIFIRRLFDSTRLSSLFQPKPVICEKAIGVAVVLMTGCGTHQVAIDKGVLNSWGLQEGFAITEAARALALDGVRVRRRIVPDRDGRPILGLAGVQAASIASDVRWMESAMRATGYAVMGAIKMEIVGENVITFRPQDAALLGPIGKDLRAYTKSLGMVEPRIASTWSKKFSRLADAAGNVTLEGEV